MPITNFQFGSVNMKVKNVTIQDVPRQAYAQREGFAGRSDRLDVRSFTIDSLHLGLGLHKGDDTPKHSKRYSTSDGLWAHQFGELTLPPALTAQSTLQSVDASGYFAANKAPVWAISSLGSTTGPFGYIGQGPYLFQVNQSTGALSLIETFTDDIVDIGEVRANSTRYFYVITDDVNDDAKVTTDPTAVSITWNTWFALASGDRVDFAESHRHLGGVGATYIQGKLGSDQGGFFLKQDAALATAPSVSPDDLTKNIPGGTAAVTITNQDPTYAGNEGVGTTNNDAGVSSGRGVWENTGNVFSSNNVDATWTAPSWSAANFSVITSKLAAYGFDISSRPRRSLLKGVSFTVEHAVGDVDDISNTAIHAQLLLDGSPVGIAKTITYTDSATDATATFGDADDTWGLGEVSDFESVGVHVWFTGTVINGGGTASFTVDHIRMTNFKYQETGEQSSVPLGARKIGVDPTNDSRIWQVRGEGDMDTTREEPRHLYFTDVSWDAATERLVVTHTPQRLGGFQYVQAACFCVDDDCMFIAAANGPDSAQTFLRLPLNTLVTEDLNWSREQGYTSAWNIVNLYPVGNDVILQLTDGTNCQDMLYSRYHDAFHFYGPAINTSGKYQTWYGPGFIDPISRYRVAMYDVSTTHLAAYRQYTPEATQLDVLSYLSAVTKEDGPLVIQMAELPVMGPEEANNALLTARCGSRDVSASNTIRLRYSLDGGSSFTTWTTFTAYGAEATLSPPIAASKVVLELALDHTASGAGTPNALPIYIYGSSQFGTSKRYTLTLDEDWLFDQRGGAKGPEALFDTLAALSPHLQTIHHDGADQGVGEWNSFLSGQVPAGTGNRPAEPLDAPGAFEHRIVIDEVRV